MLADPTQHPPLSLAPSRNGRQGNTPTSYGEGTTPEQALAVAVIMQAIQDLQSKDEQDRFEAHEFFLQPKGPWADMRRFYFQAVSLDDDWLHEHLDRRLEPPERPERKWSYHELAEVLPTDRVFRAGDLQKITDLPTGKITSKLQILMTQDRVVRVGQGVYCVPEFEAIWRARQAEAIEAIETSSKSTPTFAAIQTGPTQDAILAALRAGRETIREIGWDVEKDFNALKCALDRLIDRGLVEKNGPRYRIVQDTAA